MSFFTRVRDDVEKVLGGSAIMGVVGGFLPLPGKYGDIEKQLGQDIIVLATGQVVAANAGELAKNATQIAAAQVRETNQLKADAARNKQIAMEPQMGETAAIYNARVRLGMTLPQFQTYIASRGVRPAVVAQPPARTARPVNYLTVRSNPNVR